MLETSNNTEIKNINRYSGWTKLLVKESATVTLLVISAV